mgnify:CR=1 FL=1
MCSTDYIVESDGSLEGVGIILYKIEGTLETCKGGSRLSIKEYEFGRDFSFQNTKMCDPRVKIDHKDKFTALWQTVREAIES